MFLKNRYELKLNNNSIKKIARKSGIMYLKENLKEKINLKFKESSKNLINKLGIISEHRGAKIIKQTDLKLLNVIENFLKISTHDNIINKQCGGNAYGWCDNLPGQCQDSINHQCGGNADGWCDNLPGQCQDSINHQCGGNADGWCDNLPGQCQDSINHQCGGNANGLLINNNLLINKHKFKKIIKSYLKKSKIDINILNNIQQKIEDNITKKLLNSKNKSTNINDISKLF